MNKIKQHMKSLMMLFPNLVALCGRLMIDNRVPKADRALVAASIIYAIAPLDFLPDMIPFIGQIDDAYLISLTLLRLITRTDERIVKENWRGGVDIIQLAEAIAGLAPMILPHRISRVLASRIVVSPDFRLEPSGFNTNRPLLVEVEEERTPHKIM
jgi:uncharacterized membrane protein YkvA (DUF1232 family)